jgi:hypothetical protein
VGAAILRKNMTQIICHAGKTKEKENGKENGVISAAPA